MHQMRDRMPHHDHKFAKGQPDHAKEPSVVGDSRGPLVPCSNPDFHCKGSCTAEGNCDGDFVHGSGKCQTGWWGPANDASAHPVPFICDQECNVNNCKLPGCDAFSGHCLEVITDKQRVCGYRGKVGERLRPTSLGYGGAKTPAKCIPQSEATNCQDGWWGLSCDQPCDLPTMHCQSSSVCGSDGHCIGGCQPGWYGGSCDLECGSNGQHCADTTACDIGGKCLIYSGPACQNGWWGEACDQACDTESHHCFLADNCDVLSGTCCKSLDADGTCSWGYDGPETTVATPCALGWFGRDPYDTWYICDQECQCPGSCNPDDGSCM